MSLLVEPYNKAACDRNEKERLMRAGLFKQKTREDYLLEHIGLTRDLQLAGSTPKQQRRRAPSEGSGTPLRAAASRSLTGGQKHRSGKPVGSPNGSSMMSHSQSMGAFYPRPASRASVASRSVASSEAPEPRPRTPPTDPLIQVLMKGPPLFSPNFATAASTCI
mmetsp:Transcript_107680/g.300022  ORF Transcript_107680/g.300022 Transcript_107680/m.300022 type:complete len:164 (+) Transcript_107680:112-603(+)